MSRKQDSYFRLFFRHFGFFSRLWESGEWVAVLLSIATTLRLPILMRNDDHRRRLYEQCVQEHAASLYRVAFRLSGSCDSANELVQETFLCAWRDLAKLNDESKMRSWMFSILRNQNSKAGRRRSREQGLTEIMIENLAERAPAIKEGFRHDFQAAIERLDDDHKLPLLLVSMEGFSVEAAAEALGLPRGTVLSRLHRGRQKLKTILVRAGLDRSGHEGPRNSQQAHSDSSELSANDG